MAPDSELTRAIRAEALSYREHFDEAIMEFKAVLSQEPDFPGIHLAMGQLMERKDLEKSQEELKLALLGTPTSR